MDRVLLRKTAVFKHFGNENRTAKAIGVTRQCVNYWGRFVPEIWAMRLRDAYPELAAQVTLAKPKRRTHKRRSAGE